MATKIIINGNVETPRTLSPFAYKDLIKSLEKSNEARVTLDGKTVFRSATTSGRDVKGGRGMKYHLYFYATEVDAKIGTAVREWMPITLAEFSEYRANPAYYIDIEQLAAPVAEPAPTAEPAAEPTAEPTAEQPKRGRRARREQPVEA